MYTIIGGDGREYGPVTAEQVRRWVAAGRANLETRAKAAGGEEWKVLADFPEIVGSQSEVEPPLVGVPSAALAGRGARLGAFLLDYVVLQICLIPFFIAVGPNAFSLAGYDAQQIQHLVQVMLLGSLSGVTLAVMTIVQVLLLSLRGQTIGKFIVRVRIVRYPDAAPAGFVRAFLLRLAVMWAVYMLLPLFGVLVLFLDLGFIFRADRRRLHDHLAGTMVVRA